MTKRTRRTRRRIMRRRGAIRMSLRTREEIVSITTNVEFSWSMGSMGTANGF